MSSGEAIASSVLDGSSLARLAVSRSRTMRFWKQRAIEVCLQITAKWMRFHSLTEPCSKLFISEQNISPKYSVSLYFLIRHISSWSLTTELVAPSQSRVDSSVAATESCWWNEVDDNEHWFEMSFFVLFTAACTNNKFIICFSGASVVEPCHNSWWVSWIRPRQKSDLIVLTGL